MSEDRRRRSDIQPDDSMITKAAKMEIGGPVLDKLIRIALMVLVSGGAGSFVSEKKNVEVTQLQAELAEQKAEREVWELKYWERRRREQIEESALRDRILVLETELRILKEKH